MAQFSLEDYASVQDRIAEFYRDHPDGCIKTYMRRMEPPEVVFEARVFRFPQDVQGGVFTSGWAQEIEGKTPVNRTSFLENCETSCIGRALANLGYATDAKRPSRSEMLKVARQRKEHEEALEWLRAFGVRCPEETEINIGGGVRNAKAYIRENWPALKEQYRMVRAVIEAIESGTGEAYRPPHLIP
jgi:hypothetical protein